MKTIRDLLEFYNNLDVKPFLEAILNIVELASKPESKTTDL